MAYDPNNVFAKILRGEMPCVKVFEDNKTLAFMDVMPQSEGHVLVIPNESAANILELSSSGAAAMITTARKVALAVQAALEPDGIVLTQFNGAAAGQTVFHVHFHIIPRYTGDRLAPHARNMVSGKLLEPIAAKIRSAL
jgi:histidine triad (HIT) family protein